VPLTKATVISLRDVSRLPYQSVETGASLDFILRLVVLVLVGQILICELLR